MYFINQLILWIVMGVFSALAPLVINLSDGQSKAGNSCGLIGEKTSLESIQDTTMTPPSLPCDNPEVSRGQTPVYPERLCDGSLMSLPVARASENPERSGGTTVWTAPVMNPDGEDSNRRRCTGSDEDSDTVMILNCPDSNRMTHLNP